MDLIATIENLVGNGDQVKRHNSELLITKLAETDFNDYLEKMATILTGENYSVSSRQMAAVLIKNPITYLPVYKQKWIELNPELKEKIKGLILAALGSENGLIRKVTANVISSIAKTEIPLTEKWSSLLPILCQENFNQKSLHLAAIETLDYICEDFTKKELFPNEIDTILSAIVLGIRKNINEADFVAVGLKALIKIFPLIGSQKMSNIVIFFY